MDKDMVYCLLVYGLSTFIFILWHYFMYKKHKDRPLFDKPHFILFLVVFWSFHVFNIIYTGMMGWNSTPGSQLESQLDMICNAGIFTSLVILFRALYTKGGKLREQAKRNIKKN
jgi:hypothetical protein